MAQILAGDIRKGVTFEYKSGTYTVTEFQHVKPGKGAAFVRCTLKNVVTGQVLSDETFNPTAKLETAEVQTTKMTYSYFDGEFYVFMDEEFNQEMLKFDQVENAIKYNLPQGTVKRKESSIYEKESCGKQSSFIYLLTYNVGFISARVK